MSPRSALAERNLWYWKPPRPAAYAADLRYNAVHFISVGFEPGWIIRALVRAINRFYSEMPWPTHFAAGAGPLLTNREFLGIRLSGTPIEKRLLTKFGGSQAETEIDGQIDAAALGEARTESALARLSESRILKQNCPNLFRKNALRRGVQDETPPRRSVNQRHATG